MKGCSKPAGFKLGRAQMIPDGNLVFDYVTDVSKAGNGSFFNYIHYENKLTKNIRPTDIQ